MRTSILIADDRPLFIAGIRRVPDGVPSLDLVAEVGDGEQASRPSGPFCRGTGTSAPP